ncbi:MAG TPA: hypothetical protein VKA50_06375 [Gammaproteobacteria bacterium]|nr:hypothetical protein [Gammaproteobacteria bacterium]
MNRTLRMGLILGGLLVSAAVVAAPIAERPPLNKVGKEVARNSPLQKIPDAGAVSLPAYPGSFFERLVPDGHPPKGAYVSLVLVSNDPPAKVRAWYAKHLKGMKWFKDMKVFAKPDFDGSFASLFKMPHVSIHATTPAKLNPGLYALPNVKTEIMLGYFAK